MTISNYASALLPDRVLPGQNARADISVEILKKAREIRNRESNAIVDVVPDAKPEPVGTVRPVDLYA